jgi:hypothetical protein
MTLRWVLVFVAVILPPLLWAGYYILTGRLRVLDSMSSYYHAGGGVMRGWFVGFLFAVAAMLIVYHGFTRLEDWALNLAGASAVGVAIFPMTWPPGGNHNPISLHGVCAVGFFVCIAYVCVFQASATLALIADRTRQKRYRRTYRLLGTLMVLSPAAVFLLTTITSLRSSHIFFIEAVGVWVFASYWCFKTREISETRADHRAASGNLQRPAARLKDAFRQLSVTPIGQWEG